MQAERVKLKNGVGPIGVLPSTSANTRQGTAPKPVRAISVTGGKGGIGKSSVAVNLALALIDTGQSVMLMDADLGLANIDVMLGLDARYDISHVLSGERTLSEVLLAGPGGLKIVPASSGISRMAALSQTEQAGLIHAFSELEEVPDVFIVDTAAGIGQSVCNFCAATQEVVIVLCDEPAAITDAYALIKVLNRECGVNKFQLLANMVENGMQGRHLYSKISRVTDRFLDVHLGYLGAIPRDQYLRKAVQQQNAVVELYPRSQSARALVKLANVAEATFRPHQSSGGLGFFIERLIHVADAGVEESEIVGNLRHGSDRGARAFGSRLLLDRNRR